MNCSEYFGVGKSGYIFGKHITDNGTKGGKEMGTCHMDTEEGINRIDNFSNIDTIEKSRDRFTKKDQRKADLVRRCQDTIRRIPYRPDCGYAGGRNRGVYLKGVANILSLNRMIKKSG